MAAVLEGVGVAALIVVLIAAVIATVLAAMSWILRRNFLYALTIRGFESQPFPGDAILFVGSSTIRFWDTLARDFAPWPVVNRGFGGAVVSQVLHFAPRLIPTTPSPRAIAFYCGGNDLAWGVRVSTVLAETARFLEIARERAPDARIYLHSVCRTPSRFLSWRRVRRLNSELEQLAARMNVTWVDIDAALSSTGRPDRSLFLFDGIHPSPEGYAVWTRTLRPLLDRDLPPA